MTDSLTIFGTTYTGVTGIIATDTSDTDKTYIRPQGTKSISANGTGIDVAAYASVDVNVPTSTPTLQTKSVSVTPSETAQTESVAADTGYDGLDTVSISVGAISSTYVGTGITRRSSTDLTTSGATVSVPSGYYASNASTAVASGSIASASWSFNKTATRLEVNYSEDVSGGYISTQTKTGKYEMVLEDETVTPSTTSQTVTPTSNGRYLNSVTVEAMPSGTAGTPTATKGTVSNHSVSVTPSVTNTTGYITGGTKNGTAVTVSASELVSGSETKTANGTYDVTNLASLVVAVPLQTIYTGTSAPSSSLGSNGDVYIQTT